MKNTYAEVAAEACGPTLWPGLSPYLPALMEVCLLALSLPLGAMCHRLAHSGWPWSAMPPIFSEFLWLYLPAVIVATRAELGPAVVAILAISSLAMYLFYSKGKVSNKLLLPASPLREAITSYRSGTVLCTCFIILAVDLKGVFSHCSTKSRYYGVSLMDLGSGQYIFLNALYYRLRADSGAGPASARLWRSARSACALACVGLVRLVLVEALSYGVDVHEYGRHLNFFFILATVQVLVALVDVALGGTHMFRFGLVIMLCHQWVLSRPGVAAWLLSDDRPGLLGQNKEGLAQILGYTAMFLMCTKLGHLLRGEVAMDLRKGSARVVAPLSLLTALLWVAAHALSVGVEPPSRRLANAPYAVWVVAFSLLLLTLFVIVHALVPGPEEVAIATSVSRNMLPLFLLSNLGVGVTNSVMNLAPLAQPDAIIVVAMFAFILAFIAVYMEEIVREAFLFLSFGK